MPTPMTIEKTNKTKVWCFCSFVFRKAKSKNDNHYLCASAEEFKLIFDCII